MTTRGKIGLIELLDGIVDLPHEATPASPAAGHLRVYAKSDNLLYRKTSAGVESLIGATPPAGVTCTVTDGAPLPMGGAADRDTMVLYLTEDSIVTGFDEPDDDTDVAEVWIYNPVDSGYSLTINDESDTVSNVVTGLGAAYTLGPGQSVKARWGVGDQLWYLL